MTAPHRRAEPWQADDSRKNYDLAIRVAREQCIRRRQIAPAPGNATEARWAAEGPRPASQLDTLA